MLTGAAVAVVAAALQAAADIVGPLMLAADALRRRLDAHVAVAEAHADAGESRHAAIKQGITDALVTDLRAHGCTLPESTILEVLATDLELNAQGLAWWLDHRG